MTLLREVTAPLRWMRRALCADADPDLFYPEPGDVTARETAIRICNHCPVKLTCLRWALETGDRFAILGGKTAQQRTYILKRLKRRAQSGGGAG